jgi:hypothetical protein
MNYNYFIDMKCVNCKETAYYPRKHTFFPCNEDGRSLYCEACSQNVNADDIEYYRCVEANARDDKRHIYTCRHVIFLCSLHEDGCEGNGECKCGNGDHDLPNCGCYPDP